MIKVLIIDDEPPIRKFLKASFDPEEYVLVEAENGLTGVRLAATEAPDVVLLDLGLPDIDGVEVTKRIREWSNVPIIILSARGADDDKVIALDSGANDYLTKPFSLPELFARIRVSIRLAQKGEQQSLIEWGPFALDLASYRLLKDGHEVHLTKTEFKLFSLLAKNLGKVLTHSQILREVWGPEYEDELHYLRVYAQQIRVKTEEDPTRPRWFVTETGVGYRLRAE